VLDLTALDRLLAAFEAEYAELMDQLAAIAARLDKLLGLPVAQDDPVPPARWSEAAATNTTRRRSHLCGAPRGPDPPRVRHRRPVASRAADLNAHASNNSSAGHNTAPRPPQGRHRKPAARAVRSSIGWLAPAGRRPR
jgi:hypothetical protein